MLYIMTCRVGHELLLDESIVQYCKKKRHAIVRPFDQTMCMCSNRFDIIKQSKLDKTEQLNHVSKRIHLIG
jgi:hypothetical protein